MTAWFTIEMHLATGLVVKSEITEIVAREILEDQWRYVFGEEGLSDEDKVGRIIATQIATAVENRSGIFVLDGADGQKWLIPNANIVATMLRDMRHESGRQLGFGQLRALEARDP